ncbi:PREDICTED: vesicle-associated protein 1-4-like [Camelina sativa]|uniref:Vesicle-associated protein 1-4-like n=1 Tax=Camelina sativa TaxID=90675 RepID=A0ABM1RA76_CAMSA|nr:PREDICTED: vesicle-associated protein 1-4-like [Camelina sativa]
MSALFPPLLYFRFTQLLYICCISGQSKDHQTQNNIISSFEPLMSELDRLLGRSQVFVSFCKDELGDNFVMHLVWALRDSGINVFTDTYNPREKQQQQQVLTSSIEKSNIALAIFSKRYSESNWCLNELAKMNKLAKEGKLVVIHVFYNVKPNEVRKLQGEFGIHFRDTKERFAMEPMMVQSWEESLKSPIMTGRIDMSLEAHM